eukprot:3937158-Rhodomonas_salina.1
MVMSGAGGDIQTTFDSVSTVPRVAIAPNLHLTFSPPTNPEPAIVILVPPEAGPLLGWTKSRVGPYEPLTPYDTPSELKSSPLFDTSIVEFPAESGSKAQRTVLDDMYRAGVMTWKALQASSTDSR